MSKNQEVYISTDVETDGPIPGPHSMISYGSAAFDAEGKMIGTFTRNLALLPGATPDPDTMNWWAQPAQQKAWEAARTGIVDPAEAMADFVRWIEGLPGKPVFVGYPATFDFMFVYYYLMLFVRKSPFSFSALDMKSFAMAVLNKPYRESTKKNMPRSWFPESKHTHVALDDAIEQGHIFIAMLKAARALHKS